MKPQIDSDKWKQDYNWFSNDKLNAAGKFPNRWADVPKLGLTGAESQPARAPLPAARPAALVWTSMGGTLCMRSLTRATVHRRQEVVVWSK